jgi:hypothetical protein
MKKPCCPSFLLFFCPSVAHDSGQTNEPILTTITKGNPEVRGMMQDF